MEKARIEFEKQSQITAQQRQQTEAQRQQAAATARQQLIAASAAGTRYAGTKTGLNNSVQRVCVIFVEQKDSWLRAEVSDPDDAKAKRVFTGALRFNAEPERGGAVAYAIVLHGLPANTANPDRNSLFERAITLKLRLTGQGLEGVADAGLTDQFPIRLQRDNAPK